jgi:hypothetical protein
MKNRIVKYILSIASFVIIGASALAVVNIIVFQPNTPIKLPMSTRILPI